MSFDSQGLKDNGLIVKRDGNTEGKRLHQSKSGQQDKVPWMAVAFPEEESEVNEGAKEWDVEGPNTRREGGQDSA